MNSSTRQTPVDSHSLPTARPLSCWRRAAGLILVFPVLLAGCATAPTAVSQRPSLPDDVRERLGTIQLFPTGAEPHIWIKALHQPASFSKRGSEGHKAREGVYQETLGALSPYASPLTGLLVFPAFIAAGATELASPAIALGSSIGAGHSHEQARQAERILVTLAAEDAIRKRLHQDILEEVQASRFPTSSVQICAANLYEPSASRSARTRLEYEFLNLGLREAKGRGVKLSVNATVFCKLVRVSDSVTLHTFSLGYWSEANAARPLGRWIADDGRALRLELERCTEDLGQQLADCLLAPQAPARSTMVTAVK